MRWHGRTKDRSTCKENDYKIIPIICPSTHILFQINHNPCLFHSPISYSNNAMGIEFLVEMRQSNKYGSVKNDEIINLHLGPCVGPWDSIPCILQDTSHNLPEKAKNPEARFNSKQIISYCLGPHTQNPRLRKVDLVPSPKR